MPVYPLNELTALSPLDGRYGGKSQPLRAYFSEYALMKYRLLVEIAWLQCLAEHPDIPELNPFSKETLLWMNQLVENFSLKDAEHIKTLESTTNHDVKAIEYFLKEKFASRPELQSAVEFIHFACTSEDINNLAYALMLKAARETLLVPTMKEITQVLLTMAHEQAHCSMISRTHGQAATPTTLGKEFANFAYRLKQQKIAFLNTPLKGKINGAVGNFNAHLIAYPKVQWLQLSQTLVERLGLTWNPYTTQIEPHDYVAELFGAMMRFNSILVDLSRDIWGYISLGYFTQKIIAGEVGSSTMPHKVNPIDFENAEGNLLLSNALLSFLSQQLLTSRWQRDLVDSTLMRNLGVALSYAYIAYSSLLKGLHKLEIHKARMEEDLKHRYELLAEPIQTVMRRYGVEGAYEQLKALTRGQEMSQKTLHQFIDTLPIPQEAKEELKALKPETYTGLAAPLALRV